MLQGAAPGHMQGQPPQVRTVILRGHDNNNAAIRHEELTETLAGTIPRWATIGSDKSRNGLLRLNDKPSSVTSGPERSVMSVVRLLTLIIRHFDALALSTSASRSKNWQDDICWQCEPCHNVTYSEV